MRLSFPGVVVFPEILCISADGAEVFVAAVWDLTAEGLSNNGLFSHVGKPEGVQDCFHASS